MAASRIAIRPFSLCPLFNDPTPYLYGVRTSDLLLRQEDREHILAKNLFCDTSRPVITQAIYPYATNKRWSLIGEYVMGVKIDRIIIDESPTFVFKPRPTAILKKYRCSQFPRGNQPIRDWSVRISRSWRNVNLKAPEAFSETAAGRDSTYQL